MNEWMDCLVLVKASQKGEALSAIRDGVNTFWDGSCDCNGDCIEWELSDRHISYVIEYEDQKIYEDDEAWENHLDEYAAIGIQIINA